MYIKKQFFLVIFFINCLQAQVSWDWSTINHSWDDLKKVDWPQGFQWGVGDSAYQTEGEQSANGKICCNNWATWPIARGQKVGNGIGRWDRYKEDIDLVVASGFDTYRTSIEWSKIEPEEGQFDDEAMQHYVEVCSYAKSKGLKVMFVLWHHTWPEWFDQKGAFEKRENNNYFKRFCEYVVRRLYVYVDLWSPLNEPEAYAISAYFLGCVPPGKKSQLRLAGKVLANLLDAHVEASKVIKAIDPHAVVGMIKVVAVQDYYSWWNISERLISAFFDNLVNTSMINFFKTGHFSWKPLLIDYTNLDAPQSIDFFGVNYYTNYKVRINFPFSPWRDDNAAYPHELRSDNGAVIYPEGLYRAIVQCAEVGKPMIVTENGLAGDTHRDLYIRRHLSAVSKAIEDGYDVRGYHYWTLMDNFEWHHGYDYNYGLYGVDFANPLLPRTLREGARGFVNFLQNFSSDCDDPC